MQYMEKRAKPLLDLLKEVLHHPHNDSNIVACNDVFSSLRAKNGPQSCKLLLPGLRGKRFSHTMVIH